MFERRDLYISIGRTSYYAYGSFNYSVENKNKINQLFPVPYTLPLSANCKSSHIDG